MTIYAENPIYPAASLLELSKHAEEINSVVNDFDDENRESEDGTPVSALVPHLDKARQKLNESIKNITYEAFMTAFYAWCDQEPTERGEPFPYAAWESIIKPSPQLLRDMIQIVPPEQKQDWQKEILLWASNATWKMDFFSLFWSNKEVWDAGTMLTLSCLNREERNALLKKGNGKILAEDFLKLETIHAEHQHMNGRIHTLASQMNKKGSKIPPAHILHPKLWTQAIAVKTYNNQKFNLNTKKKLEEFLAGIAFFKEWAGERPPIWPIFITAFIACSVTLTNEMAILKKRMSCFLKNNKKFCCD